MRTTARTDLVPLNVEHGVKQCEGSQMIPAGRIMYLHHKPVKRG